MSRQQICAYHPNKKASSFCHYCERYFCPDCLNEGVKYYYCNDPKCMAAYHEEVLPDLVRCPGCAADVRPGREERVEKIFFCPFCDNTIDMTGPQPEVLRPMKYDCFICSLNVGDMALIQSILKEEGIDFHLDADALLASRTTVQSVRLYIRQDQVEKAQALLTDFEFYEE